MLRTRLSLTLALLLPLGPIAGCDSPEPDEPADGEGVEDDGDEGHHDADAEGDDDHHVDEDEDNDEGDEGDEDEGDDPPADEDEGDEDEGDEGEPDEDDGDAEPIDYPEPTEACDAEAGARQECTLEDGEVATNYCILVDGEEFETPCGEQVANECEPGDSWDQGCLGEACVWNGSNFELEYWSEPDCNTPLVVNFEDAPIEFSPASAAAFDLSTGGTCVSTDWPTAPWLALDRDGDGMVQHGGELFGNATKLSSGGFASNGFAALAELDSNLDGRIDAADERFSDLVLWSDFDGDRVGAFAELMPVAQSSLVSIDLGYSVKRDCDARGNCGFERAAFEYRSPAGKLSVGEVVDVHVACR